ncbi:MAG: NADH-quinone oxidoreductase subunit H, partial [Polyangiaceae bacterium]|nr:NADH-quinone oxidoreductase subunit H [Polyangiaceae bacterium]
MIGDPPGPRARGVARVVSWLALALVSLVAMLGCRAAEPVPQLLNLLDAGPRQLTLGDTLELTGTGFPAQRTARVTFAGTLHRPGRGEVDVRLETEGTASSSNKIDVPVSQALLDALTGKAEAAQHVTFRGAVEVSFAAITAGAMPITGTLGDVVIDARPPPGRRDAMEQQREEATRVLAMLGVTPTDQQKGGVTVAEVADDSPAHQAGLTTGDVIVALEGWNVLELGDFVPSGRSRVTTLGVLVGGGELAARHVMLTGYKPRASGDLLPVALVLGTAAALALLGASPLARLASWIDRWVRRQAGPARRERGRVFLLACVLGLLRPSSRDATSDVVSLVAFAAASTLVAMFPFGRATVGVDLDAALPLAVGATSALLASLSSGRDARGRWSLSGSLRLSAWTLAWYAPAVVAVASALAEAGSFSLADVVRAQGGSPHQWLLFRSPVGPVAALLTLAPTLLDRRLVATDDVDRGAAAALSRASVFVTSGLVATLWLGGWSLPFVDRLAAERSLPLVALGAVWLIAKTWCVAALVAVAVEAVPRPSLRLASRPLVRFALPACALVAAGAAGYLTWDPPAFVRRAVAAVLAAVTAVVALVLLRRVAGAVRAGAASDVSPFVLRADRAFAFGRSSAAASSNHAGYVTRASTRNPSIDSLPTRPRAPSGAAARRAASASRNSAMRGVAIAPSSSRRSRETSAGARPPVDSVMV